MTASTQVLSTQNLMFKQHPPTTKAQESKHIFTNAQIQTQIKGMPPKYQLIKKQQSEANINKQP